ncbi:hypothetical protein BGZ98_010422 [Dissophora globulifera]|nr:hypothetical protein BGZ98_010422 [Dissophora globulifera]
MSASRSAGIAINNSNGKSGNNLQHLFLSFKNGERVFKAMQVAKHLFQAALDVVGGTEINRRVYSPFIVGDLEAASIEAMATGVEDLYERQHNKNIQLVIAILKETEHQGLHG